MKFDFLISGHFIFQLRCVGIIHRSHSLCLTLFPHPNISSSIDVFNFSYSFQSAWYRISVSIKKNVRVQDCPDVTILNFVGLWCLWKVMAIITMYVYCHDGGHNLFPWPWSMIMFMTMVMVIALTLWLLVFKGISWAGRNSHPIHYRWILGK